jgi:glucosamine-6-phosphate deaminase
LASEKISKHSIDLAMVGIGENGHLAFNDPPANFETVEPYIIVELDEACRLQQVGEGWFPSLEAVPKQAISMSIAQIMKSGKIICSVPDERKAIAVRNSIQGEVTPQVPASILQRHPNVELVIDQAASKLLSDERLAQAKKV